MALIDSIGKILSSRVRSREHFWQLARIHLNYLYNVAIRYAGNQYDAEDLVQETYFIAFKKFDQLRDPDKIKSWLFTILCWFFNIKRTVSNRYV